MQRLLEECTNTSTSRSSFIFNPDDDVSSMTSSSHVSFTSSHNNDDDTQSWSEQSAVSLQPKLSREVLDTLLEEARSCLGIKEKIIDESEGDSDTDSEESLVESVKEVAFKVSVSKTCTVYEICKVY